MTTGCGQDPRTQLFAALCFYALPASITWNETAMTHVHTITTPRGVHMPQIIYGTAWKEQRTAACVELALESGFRGIDTACQPKHYHEPGVGEGVAAFLANATCSRAELYLQTKFTSISGQDPKRVPYDAHAPLAAQVEQSIQTSLQNLRTDYLDCLVLHSPMADMASTLAVWRAMERGCERGAVRQLGISNCYDLKVFEALCNAVRVKPSVLQNRFYHKTHYDRVLRERCRALGVVYQSFWTLTANPHLLAHETVKKLSANYRRTPAQILFRYLTLEGVAPLTGTQSAQHMQEDLAIFDFELSAAERNAISALL